ncbi:MAG TPA: hypothetical protein VKB38_05370 [Terracidiphilus sp.]|nr:hypothetical protein [Terracidiphilus sp.]
MIEFQKPLLSRCPITCLAILCIAFIFPAVAPCQQDQNSEIIRGIDASVAARDQNVLAYTVTEHYSVFRARDKDHPIAQMIVKTDYEQGRGKAYTILSESGSAVMRREVFGRLLDNEKAMNEPANRAKELITSANYTMRVQGKDNAGGRSCLIVSIMPKQNAPYLFRGKIWVDAKDESIVQLEGIASQSVSIFTGPAQISRTYANIEGFPMATHATAASSSWLLGLTTIDIDYTGYAVKLREAPKIASGTP